MTDPPPDGTPFVLKTKAANKVDGPDQSNNAPDKVPSKSGIILKIVRTNPYREAACRCHSGSTA